MRQQTATLHHFFGTQPVSRAFLFGSYARGEATAQSDIDSLVELEPGVSLFDFARMQYKLQKLVEIPVDLVSMNGLSPHVKPFVEQDKVLFYEKPDQ